MSKVAFTKEDVLKFHDGGKVAVALPKPLKTQADLTLAYTPGVAVAVKAVAANPAAAVRNRENGEQRRSATAVTA